MMDDYSAVYLYMSAAGYQRVSGYDFYKDIFPECEDSGDLHDDYSQPNAVYLYHDGERERLRRRIMLRDTWEEDYSAYVEENALTLCSGLMYRGRANKLENAQRMNALIFDIDGVGEAEFKIIEGRWNVKPGSYRSIPRPTYTVLSGSGLHLYYVFDQPISLYPNIKTQLKSLKYDLTFSIWEYGETSKEETVQYQSINQSFRMPGSYNCKEETKKRVEAFKTGDRVTVDYLNLYVVEPQNRVDIEKPFKPTKTTRKEAQERYPEWYARVVEPQLERRRLEAALQKASLSKTERDKLQEDLVKVKRTIRDNAKNRWMIEEKVHGDDPYALYHWWIGESEKVKSGEKVDVKRRIKGGHRYYFLMCMAIYAVKCGVPKEKLRADMEAVFSEISAIPHKNPLTRADMKSALEAYNIEYCDTSIKEINYWTGVGIETNKRNFRDQQTHLHGEYWLSADGRKGLNVCRAQREFAFRVAVEEGRIGRPKGSSAQREIIEAYKRDHPEAKPKDCIRDTGISKSTVYKWWTVEKENMNS